MEPDTGRRSVETWLGHILHSTSNSIARSAPSERLLYGLGVPFLAFVALICVFALTGEAWLLVPLMLVLFTLLAVVMSGILRMLGEDE